MLFDSTVIFKEYCCMMLIIVLQYSIINLACYLAHAKRVPNANFGTCLQVDPINCEEWQTNN